MSPLNAARAIAAGRLLIGAALVAAPQKTAAGWVGPTVAGSGGGQALARGLGARDVALAIGLLVDSKHTTTWLLAGVGADVVDFAAAAAAPDLPRAGRIMTLAVAGGAALGGVALAVALTQN